MTPTLRWNLWTVPCKSLDPPLVSVVLWIYPNVLALVRLVSNVTWLKLSCQWCRELRDVYFVFETESLLYTCSTSSCRPRVKRIKHVICTLNSAELGCYVPSPPPPQCTSMPHLFYIVTCSPSSFSARITRQKLPAQVWASRGKLGTWYQKYALSLISAGASDSNQSNHSLVSGRAGDSPSHHS